MDRVNYLFYQLFLKIKYEKRRYFLYVLSFYVGLLLLHAALQIQGRLNKLFIILLLKVWKILFK